MDSGRKIISKLACFHGYMDLLPWLRTRGVVLEAVERASEEPSYEAQMTVNDNRYDISCVAVFNVGPCFGSTHHFPRC